MNATEIIKLINQAARLIREGEYEAAQTVLDKIDDLEEAQ